MLSAFWFRANQQFRRDPPVSITGLRGCGARCRAQMPRASRGIGRLVGQCRLPDGFREWAYRRRAVALLQLRPGATVVEIGCGTGLNFRLVLERIGPTGQLIGVDFSAEMLERARRRIAAKGWNNVQLVQVRATDYDFPAGVDAVISTFALSLEPRFDGGTRAGWAFCAAGPADAGQLAAQCSAAISRRCWSGWSGRSPSPLKSRNGSPGNRYSGIYRNTFIRKATSGWSTAQSGDQKKSSAK